MGSNVPTFEKVPDFNIDSIKHLRSPLQFFKLFVTDDFIKQTLEQTKLYATQTGKLNNMLKKDRDEILTTDAIWCCIGIMLVMGYTVLPSRKHYWEKKGDVHNKLITESLG